MGLLDLISKPLHNIGELFYDENPIVGREVIDVSGITPAFNPDAILPDGHPLKGKPGFDKPIELDSPTLPTGRTQQVGSFKTPSKLTQALPGILEAAIRGAAHRNTTGGPVDMFQSMIPNLDLAEHRSDKAYTRNRQAELDDINRMRAESERMMREAQVLQRQAILEAQRARTEKQETPILKVGSAIYNPETKEWLTPPVGDQVEVTADFVKDTGLTVPPGQQTLKVPKSVFERLAEIKQKANQPEKEPKPYTGTKTINTPTGPKEVTFELKDGKITTYEIGPAVPDRVPISQRSASPDEIRTVTEQYDQQIENAIQGWQDPERWKAVYTPEPGEDFDQAKADRMFDAMVRDIQQLADAKATAIGRAAKTPYAPENVRKTLRESMGKWLEVMGITETKSTKPQSLGGKPKQPKAEDWLNKRFGGTF